MLPRLSLFGNATIAIGGRVIGLALSFFYLSALARHLQTDLFGEFVFLFAAAAVAVAVSDFGLWSILNRSLAQQREAAFALGRSAFWLRFLILGVLLALILISLPFTSALLGFGFLLAFLSLAQLKIFELLVAYFQVEKRMGWAAGGEIAGRAAQLLALLAVLKWLPASFLSIIATQVLGSFVQLVFAAFGAKPFLLQVFPPHLDKLKEITAAGLNLGAASLVQNFYFRSGIIALRFLSTPYQLGLFAFPFRLLELAVFVPGTFSGLLLADFSSEYQDAGVGNAAAIFNRRVLPVFVAGFMTSALFFLIGPFVAVVLGGEEWVDSGHIIRLLSPALFFVFFGSVFSAYLIARHREKEFLRASLLVLAAVIFAIAIFVPRLGASGAAWALMITEFCAAVLLGFYSFGLKGH